MPCLCPASGGEMRILAFLADPPTVKAILRHLGFPHRPPPVAPAHAPAQADPDTLMIIPMLPEIVAERQG